MAPTPNKIPGTHAHRLALTKIVSKHLLRVQHNKMVDSVCDKADSILTKIKHSKLNYHELMESFQEEMAESSEHYRERLALELDLVHKNVMAAVMDSIYARSEVIGKLDEKKMKELDLVEKVPIVDTRDSIEQEQALDLSLKSRPSESQPKVSSSFAVRKQVCFPPNDQIFNYDKTDSEDSDGQPQSMMMYDFSTVDSSEERVDESNDHDYLMKVKNKNPPFPQGQKRKSLDCEVKTEDANVKGLQVTFPLDHNYQIPMSQDIFKSLDPPKPTKPSGKIIDQLIKLAIESSPSKRLQIKDIYSYIHLHSAYHAQLGRYDPTWHKQIRGVITRKTGSNPFRGIPPAPGNKTQRSFYWTLKDDPIGSMN